MSVFVLMAVSGIAMMSASKYWRTVVQRDREAELLFRGDQIRCAIESYYKNAEGKKKEYPARLKDLLKDSRFPNIRRHLRHIYRDPMTEDGNWGIIYGKGRRVKGVFSKHTGIPIKTGNFPEKYQVFEKAETYSDWKFVYHP